MLDYIKSNMLNIIAILLFVIGSLILYKSGKKELVKKIILNLVVQAEKNLGSGTGELKYSEVIEGIYHHLPSLIRLLYTKKDIDKLIEDSVKQLQEILKDDTTLLNYTEEQERVIFEVRD